MTETEWLQCNDSTAMLKNLAKPVSFRKHGLFICACARRQVIWSSRSRNFRKAIQILEQQMDGSCEVMIRQAMDKFRHASQEGIEGSFFYNVRDFCENPSLFAFNYLWRSVRHFIGNDEQLFAREALAHVSFLREIFGNPFQPVGINPIWLWWGDRTVSGLAQAAYDERQPHSVRLDPELLAILADALEDAGCDNTEILCHLRNSGPHVRGCWVLDLLLKKE